MHWIKILPPRTALAKERLLILFLLVSLTAGIFYFTFPDPTNPLHTPACPFRTLTGLYCPGCGSGRAFHHLWRFEIYRAFRLNPLMMIFMPFLLYAYFSNWLLVLRGKSLPRFFLSGRFIICILVVILLFWVLRNIPVLPFSLLAPAELP